MLISQAFMMQEPDDARAEKNETFLKLYQWHELFQKVGFAVEKVCQLLILNCACIIKRYLY